MHSTSNTSQLPDYLPYKPSIVRVCTFPQTSVHIMDPEQTDDDRRRFTKEAPQNNNLALVGLEKSRLSQYKPVVVRDE